MMVQNALELFKKKYSKDPLVATAPGRVNLIGEHTDYNEGFVLPGAIDKKIVVAIAKNGTDSVNVYAMDYDESYSFKISDIKKHEGWANYILGVTHHIKETKSIEGIDVVVDGDVPLGGGMSSSAALCSAYGLALNELFSLGLSRLDLAYIGQKTEHTFVGAKVGIMDQFASLHGKKDHVIKLDCRSMEYEYIPFQFPEYSIVMVNTMIKHSLASSEYNVRRQQCEEGVEILKKHYPSVKSLRDVTSEQLKKRRTDLPPLVYQRCHYVVEEKERLLKGCELLKQGNLKSFGKLMYETHQGLSKEYEVSCPELDFLADAAVDLPEVAGTRMMGGGFGGCTINIVKSESVDKFKGHMQKIYENEFHKTPEVYITKIEDGAKIENS